MKVIHIVDSLNVAGGVNSFVYDLCLAMKKQNVDVSLIGILDSSEKDNDSVKKLKAHGIDDSQLTKSLELNASQS